jgi:hypothetical protein
MRGANAPDFAPSGGLPAGAPMLPTPMPTQTPQHVDPARTAVAWWHAINVLSPANPVASPPSQPVVSRDADGTDATVARSNAGLAEPVGSSEFDAYAGNSPVGFRDPSRLDVDPTVAAPPPPQDGGRMELPARGQDPMPGKPTADASDTSPPPAGHAGHGPPGSGVPVVLPNGHTVPDLYTHLPLISPVADLRAVAQAGRVVGTTFREMLNNPETAQDAGNFLALNLAHDVIQGGRFDYQRQGNRITGFTQLPQYRDVANFNVGLYLQQAGFSLDEALRLSGQYAHVFSGNAKPDQPYGLEVRTADLIRTGYNAGASGAFGQAATRLPWESSGDDAGSAP